MLGYTSLSAIMIAIMIIFPFSSTVQVRLRYTSTCHGSRLRLVKQRPKASAVTHGCSLLPSGHGLGQWQTRTVTVTISCISGLNHDSGPPAAGRPTQPRLSNTGPDNTECRNERIFCTLERPENIISFTPGAMPALSESSNLVRRQLELECHTESLGLISAS
jgi:hypothetical protein